MADHSELVKALRHYNGPSYKMTRDAAAAIETLTRQVKNLERALRRNGEWQSTRN